MSIRAALISGLASRFYVAALNLLSVPILLRWLGIEAMGLIGLIATIQALFSVVEAALASVVTHHTATLPGGGDARVSSLAVLRGVEKGYWVSTPIILVLSFVVAAFFLQGWANNTQLGLGEATLSVALLGASAALLWPTSYYGAVLYGVGRQGTVGLVTSITWTARIVIGLALLLVFGKKPSVYFAWQAVTTLLCAIALRFVVVRAISGWPTIAGNVRRTMREIGRSVISLSAVTAAALVFNQIDKLIIGRIFSLETFGYYSLAWQLAGAIYLIYTPVYSAFLPAISRAHAAGDNDSVSRLMTDAMVVMGLLVLPLGACVTFVSEALLFAWTGNAATAAGTSLFLKLAFAGAVANALLFVPFAAQVPTNTTAITLRAVVGSIVAGLPLMVLGSIVYGAAAVVGVWAVVSIVQVGVVIYFTVTRILRVPIGRWAWRSLGVIALPAIAAMAAFELLVPDASTRIGSALFVVGAFALCYAITLLVNRRTVTSMVSGSPLRGVREAQAARAPSFGPEP